MNKVNFNQAGGFPLETDDFSNIQDAYSIFNALGKLAGEKVIIKGCVANGNTVSNGIVYLDGEVFEFQGGYIQSKVILKQEVTSKPFENGETKEVHYKRYVTFGAGIGAVLWSDFVRINPIKEIQKAVVPVGLISMWSGAISNIPSGWALCDGKNGTPNLSGKFIVGYASSDPDYNQTAKTGGAKKVTLTTEEMPSHSHNGTTNTAGEHSHGGIIYNGGYHNHDYKDSYFIEAHGARQDQYSQYGSERVGTGFSGSGDTDTDNKFIWYRNGYTSAGGEHSHVVEIYKNGKHNHLLSIDPTGGNKAHENRPPYYTLAYIIFKG